MKKLILPLAAAAAFALGACGSSTYDDAMLSAPTAPAPAAAGTMAANTVPAENAVTH